MKKISVFGLLFFCMAVSLVFAQAEPRKGGTLIWGTNADPISLDPAIPTDGDSAKVVINIFEGLVRYQEGSTEVEPALAVSWKVSGNGKEWIFYLRKGVVFHDGTPFNANAVVFSFSRQIDPKHPFYQKNFGYAAFTFKYVKSVKAVDEHTVRISLSNPFAPFLFNLAMPFASKIVSPTALKKWGNNFEKHPVGTGPLRFSEWIQGDRVVLERNPDYWSNPAYLDKVVLKPIINNTGRLLALKTSAIHGMDIINPKAVRDIRENKHLRMMSIPGLNVGYLAMNTEKPPFNRLKVRQAVNHAINRQNLVKFIYKGLAVPAHTPVPPVMWGYNDKITGYEYNPAKAKQLLKEDGFEHGFETTLWTMPVARQYMAQPKKIARIIKANLGVLGIKARIVSYDWKTYLAKVRNGEHDMCLIGWVGDNGDPDNFLYVLLDKDNAVKPKGTNQAFFKHDGLHEILIKAQQINERQERIRLYHKAQEIIHEQAPWVPLAHARQIVAHRKNVHGIIQRPTGGILFGKAWIVQGMGTE
ncbi:MAG: ABC transporter substrate-binding protein [Desulfobacteraceae bacterium]|nr:ABC transporter substrate-binding protein [Desulfobacteraceae bacterium]